MKNILILIVFLIALTSGVKKEQPINTLSKKEVSKGWKLLFNGNDLTGWKHFNGGELTDWKARKEAGKWKDVPTYGISETGHISLQDHGGLTLFRSIKIKVLP